MRGRRLHPKGGRNLFWNRSRFRREEEEEPINTHHRRDSNSLPTLRSPSPAPLLPTLPSLPPPFLPPPFNTTTRRNPSEVSRCSFPPRRERTPSRCQTRRGGCSRRCWTRIRGGEGR
ncbi:hypothetical protein BDY24DRAFT_390736 [Mrakia frigida]|uniref:uncharacterized protein n=1 Tax=Mrakia frigida TaxID=29902 RepID=UPI003FCC23E8